MIEVVEGSGVFWYSHQWANCSARFSKEGPTPSQVKQKINMKSVEARRPQRV
jgi:hypothetical protein